MDKHDKLLLALRTRAHELFELYLEGIVVTEGEKSLVDSYKLSEEFILKDGRKIRVTESGNLQQIVLFEGDKQVLVKRVIAGYVVEATDGLYTACRRLTDGEEHLPVGERERPVLF